jgi:hypothetical protein
VGRNFLSSLLYDLCNFPAEVAVLLTLSVA